MDITVEDINSVDKEIIITANRKDLQPKFDKAYKKYKKQLALPGFRPGRVPVPLVRKRFGDEIEKEEVSNYVEEVFENEVLPEHESVGDPQMVDLTWEDDELEAKFKFGRQPEFELVDLENIQVDMMVHDVTDEEVKEELDSELQQEGDWEEVDEPVTETSQITANATPLDEDDEPIEGATEEDQIIDLNSEGFSNYKSELLGKKTGDIVVIKVEDEDEQESFKLLIKKVEKIHPAKLTDAFAQEQSDGEAKNVDEYKSLIKSQLQNYYDHDSEDLFKNELIDVLVKKHEFEVPEMFLEQVLNGYIHRMEDRLGAPLPEDIDIEPFKEIHKKNAVRDARWFFINEKLQDEFDDIEIEADDIDERLTAQAAQFGATVDQMRSMYAENPEQLETLRNHIREEKIFERLKDIVSINELDKETYQIEHFQETKEE